MTEKQDRDTWPKLPKLEELKLYQAGADGEPDIFLGDGSLKFLDKTKDRVWLAGVFKAPGRRIQVNGPAEGVPISALPPASPGGRPKREKEHMAQCLAWAYVRQKKRTHLAADEEVMKMFGRVHLDKFEAMRRDFMKRIDDAHTIRVPGGEGDGIGYAALIERPTVYCRPDAFEILGDGWAWHTNLKNGAAVRGPMRMTGPTCEYVRQLVNAPRILVVST